MMMAPTLNQPEVVVVDELWPLLVVGQQEGVDVAHADHWHADNKESLSKSKSILNGFRDMIIFELCDF